MNESLSCVSQRKLREEVELVSWRQARACHVLGRRLRGAGAWYYRLLLHIYYS